MPDGDSILEQIKGFFLGNPVDAPIFFVGADTDAGVVIGAKEEKDVRVQLPIETKEGDRRIAALDIKYVFEPTDKGARISYEVTPDQWVNLKAYKHPEMINKMGAELVDRAIRDAMREGLNPLVLTVTASRRELLLTILARVEEYKELYKGSGLDLRVQMGLDLPKGMDEKSMKRILDQDGNIAVPARGEIDKLRRENPLDQEKFRGYYLKAMDHRDALIKQKRDNADGLNEAAPLNQREQQALKRLDEAMPFHARAQLRTLPEEIGEKDYKRLDDLLESVVNMDQDIRLVGKKLDDIMGEYEHLIGIQNGIHNEAIYLLYAEKKLLEGKKVQKAELEQEIKDLKGKLGQTGSLDNTLIPAESPLIKNTDLVEFGDSNSSLPSLEEITPTTSSSSTPTTIVTTTTNTEPQTTNTSTTTTTTTTTTTATTATTTTTSLSESEGDKLKKEHEKKENEKQLEEKKKQLIECISAIQKLEKNEGELKGKEEKARKKGFHLREQLLDIQDCYIKYQQKALMEQWEMDSSSLDNVAQKLGQVCQKVQGELKDVKDNELEEYFVSQNGEQTQYDYSESKCEKGSNYVEFNNILMNRLHDAHYNASGYENKYYISLEDAIDGLLTVKDYGRMQPASLVRRTVAAAGSASSSRLSAFNTQDKPGSTTPQLSPRPGSSQKS